MWTGGYIKSQKARRRYLESVREIDDMEYIARDGWLRCPGSGGRSRGREGGQGQSGNEVEEKTTESESRATLQEKLMLLFQWVSSKRAGMMVVVQQP